MNTPPRNLSASGREMWALMEYLERRKVLHLLPDPELITERETQLLGHVFHAGMEYGAELVRKGQWPRKRNGDGGAA